MENITIKTNDKVTIHIDGKAFKREYEPKVCPCIVGYMMVIIKYIQRDNCNLESYFVFCIPSAQQCVNMRPI